MLKWLSKFKYKAVRRWCNTWNPHNGGIIGYENGFGWRKIQTLGSNVETTTLIKAMYWKGGGEYEYNCS